MNRLPQSVQDFIRQQNAVPVASICPEPVDDGPSPYASHWYRAVAGMLLSGRVAAKHDGLPNMTELNRVCKEANFNQYLCERMARFLIAAKVLKTEKRGRYQHGPNQADFWTHADEKLPSLTAAAVLHLVQERMGSLVWRSTLAMHSGLSEFLKLFFGCFRDLAVREDQFGAVLLGFSRLPETDLILVGKGLGLKRHASVGARWEAWLDSTGQAALRDALYTAEWLYGAEHKKTRWILPSPIGLGMLGVGPVPPAPTLAKELKAASNLAVFAGAGLPLDKLVTLFRYCKIKRIDQFYEFQVERRRLEATSASARAGDELREALADLSPLPATIASVLDTKSKVGGKLGIRWCSALVKPDTDEVLAAIRAHPRLKGYLEPGAPAGYLLIKPRSNPNEFVRRCQGLGFKVEML